MYRYWTPEQEYERIKTNIRHFWANSTNVCVELVHATTLLQLTARSTLLEKLIGAQLVNIFRTSSAARQCINTLTETAIGT